MPTLREVHQAIVDVRHAIAALPSGREAFEAEIAAVQKTMDDAGPTPGDAVLESAAATVHDVKQRVMAAEAARHPQPREVPPSEDNTVV